MSIRERLAGITGAYRAATLEAIEAGRAAGYGGTAYLGVWVDGWLAGRTDSVELYRRAGDVPVTPAYRTVFDKAARAGKRSQLGQVAA